MGFFLSRQAVLKWLETPSVYHLGRDELYELDQESFAFLRSCASGDGCSGRDSAFIDYCLGEGLLTRERAGFRRPDLKPSPDPSLRYLELQLTDRCNLRCRHCYLGDPAGRELSVLQARGALKEFEELQGLRVLLTGGEPLVHSRFDEINELLPDLMLRKVLFTNGTLLSRGILKRLKVQEIQVSIDGMQAAHDAVRGPGTWEKAVAALQNAAEAGFEVSAATMVHAGNLKDFDELEALVRGAGAREWTVDVPCSAGRMRNDPSLAVSIEDGGRCLGYGFGGGMHASREGYGCGLHLMAVLPDGSAAKCTFYGDRPVGTLAEGLAACWERVRPVALDKLACSCDFVNVCRGGCRFRAELTEGASGRDPYRCSLYGIIDKPPAA